MTDSLLREVERFLEELLDLNADDMAYQPPEMTDDDWEPLRDWQAEDVRPLLRKVTLAVIDEEMAKCG